MSAPADPTVPSRTGAPDSPGGSTGALDTRPALRFGNVEALRGAAVDALARLSSDQQREFVVRYVQTGNATRAAVDAGYSEKSASDVSKRVKARPEVAEAIRAVAAVRGAEARFSADDLHAMLAAALDFDVESLYVRNAEGHPIGLRELSSLSAAERLRVKSLNVKMRRSAKGERAHFVTLEAELVDPLSIVDRIARLGGFYAAEGGVSVNVAALGETHLSAGPAPLDPLWAEVLDALLSEAELRDYFAASGDEERRAILRPAVNRLRLLL